MRSTDEIEFQLGVACSAVVETLFESELFGHVKGSFTGAICDKPGLFEHAHGGTIFLDEIGDMPLAMQGKLLRVLQNQEVRRVGGLNTRETDVHVVAATNLDLRAAVLAKRFREDLYYRLSMVEIHVPPLADRLGDLALLERRLIARFAAQFRKPIRGITHRARMLLSQHSWPGNIRELENVLGHACMMTTSALVDILDLPPYLQRPVGQTKRVEEPPAATLGSGTEHENACRSSGNPNQASTVHRERYTLAAQERSLILQALQRTSGNQTRAAELLQISRDTLRYRLKKHNLARLRTNVSIAVGDGD